MNHKKVIALVIILITLIITVIYINGKMEVEEGFEKEFAIEPKEKNEEKEVIAEEEKISPKAIMIKEINYKKCEHTTRSVEKIPSELVNLTFNELKDKIKSDYKEWILKDYNEKEVKLYKTCEEECDQEFILREKNGKIAIFRRRNDIEELFEETNIEIEYLTDIDKEKLKNGISLFGRENLNSTLEDYE